MKQISTIPIFNSYKQLNGKYTLRMEFGRECREFMDLTYEQLSAMSIGLMEAPYDDDQRFLEMEYLREQAMKNDNTGGS